MCSTSGLVAAVAALDTQDVATFPDAALRDDILELLVVVNQVHAQVARRLAAFDTRGLSIDDGCRTTKSWLRAFGRMTDAAAGAWVKTARLLRQLPHLAQVAAAGQVSDEHITRVARLADRVGPEPVRQVEDILTQTATELSPTDLQKVCDRVRAYVDPDGPEPDAHADYQRRGLTLTRFDGMLLVRGQLDPEGAAALTAALDAFMTPPTTGNDDRTPTQRRADALVELARSALTTGRAPTVGGVRPQIGVLLRPQTLIGNASASGNHPAARQWTAVNARDPNATDPNATKRNDAVVETGVTATAKAATEAEDDNASRDGHRGARGDPLTEAGIAPLPEAAWLEWFGDIPDAIAQRLACDAEIWRIVLHPATGLPLDVGRSHRLVPHWIRKALWARDRGCRFPGCQAPVAWTDAHHLDPWALGGRTTVDRLLLLCRHHHVLIHEGGWSVQLDPATGAVTATRPDGRPYEIPSSRPWLGPDTRQAA